MTRWSKMLTTEDDDTRLDAGWQRVRARRARPRIVRRALVAAPVLALAAVLLLVVRGWLAPAAALTTTASVPVVAPALALAPIALAGGAALPAEWSAPAPALVALDDGSRLELAPRTVLKRGAGAADRVELAVESGSATFDVKPNGPRSWVIGAGPVVVRVLGTRFTVTRAGDVVEVTVERGKVEVTAADGRRVLLAGESFRTANATATANANANAIATANATAIVTAKATANAEVARAPAPAAAAPAAAAAAAPAAAAAAAPAPAPADPLARADALRRAGNPSAAVTALRDIVDARDARSALAAFTIGKIEAEDLHDFSSAAGAFERAIALGLPSGLDEEAHARAVECFARAGSRSEVARAAKRYEARFPEGRHLARVREWSRD